MSERERRMLRQKEKEKIERDLDEEFLRITEPISQWIGRILWVILACVALETLYWLTILAPVGFLAIIDRLLTVMETGAVLGLAALFITQAIQAQRFEDRKNEVLAPYQDLEESF